MSPAPTDQIRDGAGSFSVEDFDDLTASVLAAWGSGADRDWTVPAGTLDWTCWATADHTVDCVFSYALFLASRCQERYPPFGELRAFEAATPSDLIDGLRAVTTMLSAVIRAAAPGTRAVILQRPPLTGDLDDFAARGALEMVLHAHDVCTGLGIDFDPPRDLCSRLLGHTGSWVIMDAGPATDDPWSQLLERSGRPRGR